MKKDKSPDGQGIKAKHLKFGGNVFQDTLSQLSQKIVEEGKVPVEFKRGKITLIHKGTINHAAIQTHIHVGG